MNENGETFALYLISSSTILWNYLFNTKLQNYNGIIMTFPLKACHVSASPVILFVTIAFTRVMNKHLFVVNDPQMTCLGHLDDVEF